MLHTILAITFATGLLSILTAAVQSVFVVRPLLADAGVQVEESSWGWLLLGYPLELFSAFRSYAAKVGLTGFTVWHARWYVRIQLFSWSVFWGALLVSRASA